jgi:hypothetical protein
MVRFTALTDESLVWVLMLITGLLIHGTLGALTRVILEPFEKALDRKERDGSPNRQGTRAAHCR